MSRTPSHQGSAGAAAVAAPAGALTPADQTTKLVRLCVMLASAAVVAILGCAIALYVAAGKRVIVIGATDTGRFIPAVALDRPYLNEPRIQALAEECLRRSFAHDFRNFRQTMGEATSCYTPRAGALFNKEMQPLLADLVERRMVMTAVMDRPPVVVGASVVAGVHTWTLQAQVTLSREGTRERVPPSVFAVKLLVSRVPLEESLRGALISFISLSPA
jgi:hypothetical protein